METIVIEVNQRAITKYNGLMQRRAGGIFLRPEVKVFEAAVRYKALKVYQGPPLVCPLRVDIEFNFSDNKMPDLYNLPKAVCDALNTKKRGDMRDAGVWLDDRQIVIGTVSKQNVGRDFIRIVITPLVPTETPILRRQKAR